MAETNAPFYDFIKSGLYTAGASGGKLHKGYQDPTYLTFSLMFVPGGGASTNPNGVKAEYESPLFSKDAEDFLAKLQNGADKRYDEKLQALKDFKEALFRINSEMPWYWQSLAGVDKMVQFDPLKPYWGGADAKITITCLETINLAITGLMALYRKAVFDEEKWCYVLPANLRRFSMWIYVKDIRTIDTAEYADNAPINQEITGGNTPGLAFLLTYCEFDIASGSKALETLSNAEYSQASQEISINYGRMNRVDGKYLQGVIVETTESINQTDIKVPPTVNTKSIPNDPLNLNKTVDAYKKKFSKDALNDKFKQAQELAKDQLTNLANKKKEELLGKVTSTINDKIPTFENVLMNAVNKIDQASNVNNLLTPKAIEETVKGNVYGISAGQSIVNALNQAAAAGLGNVYK
jgi:hypothetical protein